MGTRRLAVIAALATLLLAGCAAGTDDPESGGTVSSPAKPPEPTGPSATPGQPTTPPAPGRPSPTRLPPVSVSPPGATDLTLTGTVAEGVEANCLLLETPSGAYLLVTEPGVDRSPIRAGARITVRGRVDHGLMTTCQQGTPFRVSEVRPA